MSCGDAALIMNELNVAADMLTFAADLAIERLKANCKAKALPAEVKAPLAASLKSNNLNALGS